MVAEEWRAIPGWEGEYDVSSLGRVRSVTRLCYNGKVWTSRLRVPKPANKRGHLKVMLYRAGRGYARWVHRLVLSAFDRLPIGREDGRHKDRNPTNNKFANLKWGTRKQNVEDAMRHGTNHKPPSRYNETDFERMRDLRRFGLSYTQVAKQLGCAVSFAHSQLRGG